MKTVILLSLAAAVAVAVAAGSSQAQEPAGEGAEEPETAAESTPRRFTVEDLWAMERLGSPAVSPDGRWIAFTVTTFSREENKGQSDLWLVATDGSSPARRLTWNEGGDGSPAWSPDGRYLAFVSKRGEGPGQLYRLPMEGGEAEPLTDLPIGVGDPKWFPDGRRIAFVADTFPDLNDDFEKVKERLDAREEDKTKVKISDRRLLRYWDHYTTDGTVPHVFVLDLESRDAGPRDAGAREVKDLMPGYDDLAKFREFAWDLSPDGGEIAFAANSTEPPWQKLDFNIYLLSVESGEMLLLTENNPAEDGSPVYSPDGRYLLFGRTHRPEISPDFVRLARYDRESGEIVELAADWDHEPGDWVVTPDGRTVLLHAQDGGRRNLYAMAIDGGQAPRLVARGGVTSGVAATGDGRAVFLRQSFHRPADLWTVELAGGEPEQLTSFNAELLSEIDFGTVEDVTFEGSGGDPVQMHVLHPPGFDRSEKWPLLVLVHGGPHGAWLDSFHYRWNAALFAAPGYVVAAVNFHGSTGFGQAFAESILGNHAEKPFEDVMKATDHLLATGYVDGERMAAAGGSYGGYMMSWILGHSDRFQALIDHAGVYDLMAQYASDYTWSEATTTAPPPGKTRSGSTSIPRAASPRTSRPRP